MTIHDVIGILDEMLRDRTNSPGYFRDNRLIRAECDVLKEARDRIQAFYDDEAVTPEIEE